MKRALLIGIDTYSNFEHLAGCVNDVHALVPLLSRNEDDSPNFDCHSLTSMSDEVSRRRLLEALDTVLAPGADVAILYFAGHGEPSANDVVLVTQDGIGSDAGVALSVILGKVQKSDVPEVVIILDCCFAGGAGGVPQLGGGVAALRRSHYPRR